MAIEKPYLLFLGDVRDALAAKTAHGVVDWRREWCVGQFRLPGCQADTGLPDMDIAAARKAGAKTLVIGAVNAGGMLPESWIASIVAAIEAGMDVASGLHDRLVNVPAIRAAAEAKSAKLHEVRPTRTGNSPPARARSARASGFSPSARIAPSARNTRRWRSRRR